MRIAQKAKGEGRSHLPSHPTNTRLRLVVVVEGFDAKEDRAAAQLFFDAEKLVVLGDAVGAADRAGLDLANAGGDGEVGDEGVLGFARAVSSRLGGRAPGQLLGV